MIVKMMQNKIWYDNTSYSYCITHKIHNLEWTIHIRLLLNSYLIPYIVNGDKITSFVCDSETNGSIEKCYRSIDKLTALIYLDISLVAIMSRPRPAINRGAKLATAFNGNYAIYMLPLWECLLTEWNIAISPMFADNYDRVDIEEDRWEGSTVKFVLV